MIQLPSEIQAHIIGFIDFYNDGEWSEEYTKLIYDAYGYNEDPLWSCRFKFVAETLPHLLYDKMVIEQLFLGANSQSSDTEYEKRYCDYQFNVKDLDQKAQNRYSWAQMIAKCFLKNNIDRKLCMDLAKNDPLQPQNRWHDVLAVLPAKLTDIPAEHRQQSNFEITFTQGYQSSYDEYRLQFDHIDENNREVYKLRYIYSYESPCGCCSYADSVTNHIVAFDIVNQTISWISGDKFNEKRFADTFKDSMLQKLVNILFSDDEEDLSRIYITDW